jgi:voltage-gated potassium channel
MVAGLGTLVYVATAGLELVLEDLIGGRLAQRVTQRRINRMSGHVVLCGYGRIGRTAYVNLKNLGREVVVVESNRDRAEDAEHAGAAAVLGDATADDVLRQAGIERADVLIAAVGSDSDNVSIILSARALAPEVRVVARASEPRNESKLRLAGADRVVSPVNVGAERLVAMAAEADLTDFVDITFEGDLLELRVEEVHIPEGSRFVGMTLGESDVRHLSGAIIIAIRHADGQTNLSPDATARMASDSTLVGIGTRQQLEALHRLVGP